MAHQEYVAGFLFNDEETLVALVRKNRPPWQAGYLNGVGGKIEPGETPPQAMVREFEEETGVGPAAYTSWLHTVTLTGPGFRVYFFMTHTNGILDLRFKASSEPVSLFRTRDLHTLHVVPNLLWLIPLSLNQHISGPMTGTIFPVQVYEEQRER